MTDTAVIQIAVQTLIVTAKLAAPVLVASLVIGLAVSVLQSMTQVQEFTLSFVPKLVGLGVVLVVSGNWMLQELISFTRGLFEMLPGLLA